MARQEASLSRVWRIRRIIGAWPRIFSALAVSIGVLLLLRVLAPQGSWTTRFLIAWDVGVVFFLAALLWLAWGADPEDIRSRAARQDVGRFTMLVLNGIAAVASVGAIYAELGVGGTADASWRLVLALVTIALSWFFIHFNFAFHYAHEFYQPEAGKPGGLAFPGGRTEPDYWDFLYFALVVGMTSQVSDVAVLDRRIRRTVMVHGVMAFFFNVALLALVVNVAADAIR